MKIELIVDNILTEESFDGYAAARQKGCLKIIRACILDLLQYYTRRIRFRTQVQGSKSRYVTSCIDHILFLPPSFFSFVLATWESFVKKKKLKLHCRSKSHLAEMCSLLQEGCETS